MEALAGLGIFLGGLGVFFLGCGLFWWISLYKEYHEEKRKKEK